MIFHRLLPVSINAAIGLKANVIAILFLKLKSALPLCRAVHNTLLNQLNEQFH